MFPIIPPINPAWEAAELPPAVNYKQLRSGLRKHRKLNQYGLYIRRNWGMKRNVRRRFLGIFDPVTSRLTLAIDTDTTLPEYIYT